MSVLASVQIAANDEHIGYVPAARGWLSPRDSRSHGPDEDFLPCSPTHSAASVLSPFTSKTLFLFPSYLFGAIQYPVTEGFILILHMSELNTTLKAHIPFPTAFGLQGSDRPRHVSYHCCRTRQHLCKLVPTRLPSLVLCSVPLHPSRSPPPLRAQAQPQL